MIDVRLISLIPPSQAVTQAPGAPAVTTQGGAIVPQLPAGSVLAGFIINRDASGNPILRTDQGDFTFSSNFFLKIGSEVVIRIQQSAGHNSAHIVTVNGQPPEVATQQSGFADAPEVIVGQKQPALQQPATQPQTANPAAPALPTPKAGQTISAIVVAPAPPAASAAAPPAPGTSLLLSVLGVNPPQAQTQTPPSPLAQLVPAAPAPTAGALSTLLPVTNAGEQQPAATVPQALSPQPPSPIPSLQSAPVAASNREAATAQLPGPLGQTVVATVASVNDDGSIILNTPLGVLRVAEVGGPPPGQQLTLRVTSVAGPNGYTVAVANSAAPAPAAPITELARAWTSLQQIAQALGQEASSRFIPTFPAGAPITPDLPGRITGSTSQILFFIAALKGGDLRDWLGSHNVKALEDKGYGSLVRKAQSEFLLMARQFAEPQPGNWQSTFIPVLVGGEVQQLRAFFKREKKKNEQGRPTGDEDTRFVVEMELSQLGEMQMDGLVKRRAETLQFDLIIRSHEPLSKAVEQDIQAIYASTAEATGYRGQLSFQAVFNFPLHPLEDIAPHIFDDVVV